MAHLSFVHTTMKRSDEDQGSLCTHYPPAWHLMSIRGRKTHDYFRSQRLSSRSCNAILPPFLFHYMDGGIWLEYTLRRNVEDLFRSGRQRNLKTCLSLKAPETTLF